MAVTKQILADLIILNPKHKENTVSKLMRLTKDKLLAECKELGIEIPETTTKVKKTTTSKPRAKKEIDNSTEEKRNLTSRYSKKEGKGDFVTWIKAQRWIKNGSGEYENEKSGEVLANIHALFGIFEKLP
jgi:hypothetical protein